MVSATGSEHKDAAPKRTIKTTEMMKMGGSLEVPVLQQEFCKLHLTQLLTLERLAEQNQETGQHHT
jgi:hypothetical protein